MIRGRVINGKTGPTGKLLQKISIAGKAFPCYACEELSSLAARQENGIADYNESYLSGYDGAKSSFVAAFTVAEDLPETSESAFHQGRAGRYRA